MNESAGVVRQVAFGELFPWLILFRTFRIAISPSLLALAAAAVLIAPWGWWVASRVLLTERQREDKVLTGQSMPQAANSELAAKLPGEARSYLPSVQSAFLAAYFDLAEPFHRFFHYDITLREAGYYLVGMLWTLALWAFPGAVIARRAVQQLATGASAGFWRDARFAGRRYAWYFLAPLYPLVGVILLALPISLVGLLFRLSPGLGAVVAGLLWLIVILAGLAAMWLLGGLLFGWPLMWPTISAEREGDAFEAFSRSYSYVYGKPLHYFFYVVVAAAFGALCWAVVIVAGQLVQEFGFWALSWGSGGEAAISVRNEALDIAQGEYRWQRTGAGWKFGTLLIGWTLALLHAFVTAFRFTYFFTAASAIYLLLRHDVDEKEIDEVFSDTSAVAMEN